MQTTQRAETAQLKTATASVTATSEAVPAVLPYIIACKTKLVSAHDNGYVGAPPRSG